jgi:hypothetical protein
MVGNWLARLLLANKLLGLLVDFPIPNLDWPFLGHPVQRHQQHHHSTRLIFFSRIRRRAAHLCIKKKKYGPLQTPPPHSGPSCEGLLKQEKRNLKKKQIKVRPDQLHLAKN